MQNKIAFYKLQNSLTFLILILLISHLIPEPVFAGTGAKGWCTVTRTDEACFASPQQACEKQRDIWGDDAPLYATTAGSKWWIKECDWELCRGFKRPGCALVHPGSVSFECDNEGVKLSSPDYLVRAEGERCIKRSQQQQERKVCLTVGDPIIVSSGALVENFTDFETNDGLLSLKRHYRSFTSSILNVYQQTSMGLAQGWHFDFTWELHIHDGFHINGELTLYAPDGSAYNFERQSDGSIVPVDADAEQIRLKLAFIGEWPENLEEVTDNGSEWLLTDSNNTTYRLNAFKPYDKTQYTIARPIQITAQDGYQQNLTYGELNELKTLSDSFGRTLSFNWLVDNSNPNRPVRPLAIDRVTLPDGSAITYGYESSSVVEGVLNLPDRLVSVTRLTSSGVIDSNVVYHYEDVRFPHSLTGMTDARDIRSRTWVYDDFGRAISSEGANGLNKTTIVYDDDETPSRIVTNPLGKKTVYHYERGNSTIKPSSKLTAIDGKPSANCVGSKRVLCTFVRKYTLS